MSSAARSAADRDRDDRDKRCDRDDDSRARHDRKHSDERRGGDDDRGRGDGDRHDGDRHDGDRHDGDGDGCASPTPAPTATPVPTPTPDPTPSPRTVSLYDNSGGTRTGTAACGFTPNPANPTFGTGTIAGMPATSNDRVTVVFHGQPLAAVSVQIQCSIADATLASGTTDASGAYTMTATATGMNGSIGVVAVNETYTDTSTGNVLTKLYQSPPLTFP